MTARQARARARTRAVPVLRVSAARADARRYEERAEHARSEALLDVTLGTVDERLQQPQLGLLWHDCDGIEQHSRGGSQSRRAPALRRARLMARRRFRLPAPRSRRTDFPRSCQRAHHSRPRSPSPSTRAFDPLAKLGARDPRDIEQWSQRPRREHRIASGPQDPRATSKLVAESLQQGRLADSGLPAHEHEPPAPAVVDPRERRMERR
jgi:hypothetical protein